VFNLLKTQPFM